MRKWLSLPGIIFVSILTLALFQVKYKVVDLEDSIKALNREIFKAEESLHILKAEWAYRTSPLRLTQLAKKHLKLVNFKSQQFETCDFTEFTTKEPFPLQIAYKERTKN